MAHQGQRDFIELMSKHLDRYFRSCKVLEIGSLDVNGTVRDFFSDCDYVGIDLAAGKGVDVVCEGQHYDAPDGSFDHVICCEVMEHNPYWRETMANMVRLCRPGGLVTMTCATTGRAEHGTARTTPGDSPLTIGAGWEYYRNLSAGDFRRIAAPDEAFAAYRFWTNWSWYDPYFCGIKRGDAPGEEKPAGWEALVGEVDRELRGVNGSMKFKVRAMLGGALGDRGFETIRRVRNAFRAKRGESEA